jgi:hypothetical protein
MQIQLFKLSINLNFLVFHRKPLVMLLLIPILGLKLNVQKQIKILTGKEVIVGVFKYFRIANDHHNLEFLLNLQPILLNLFV